MLARGTIVDGRYEVEGTLEEGPDATVYRVRRTQLGTLHALKVITSTDPGVRERLFREGKLQGKLHHPHVAAISDLVEVEGRPALVMEYLGGGGLDALLAREQLTLPQIDRLADGLLRGVQAAHAQGVLHRGLRPEVVRLEVVDGEARPKITDFGLARALDDDPDTMGQGPTGGPHYLAPEQLLDDGVVDHRADVWALGAILYQMVARERPFEGANAEVVFRRILEGERREVRELVPDLPDRMVRAIEGALVVDPRARLPTVEALGRAWRGDGVARGPFTESVLDRMLVRGQGEQADAEAVDESATLPPFSLRSDPPHTFALDGAAGPGDAVTVERAPPSPARPSRQALTLPSVPPEPAPSTSRGWLWVLAALGLVFVAWAAGMLVLSVLGIVLLAG